MQIRRVFQRYGCILRTPSLQVWWTVDLPTNIREGQKRNQCNVAHTARGVFQPLSLDFYVLDVTLEPDLKKLRALVFLRLMAKAQSTTPKDIASSNTTPSSDPEFH
jgi:hypothetical protein